MTQKTADIQYFEIPLSITEGRVYTFDPAELGQGFDSKQAVIDDVEAQIGINAIDTHAVEISESDLGYPVASHEYSSLSFYRVDTGNGGSNYFGVAEKMAGGF